MVKLRILFILFLLSRSFFANSLIAADTSTSVFRDDVRSLKISNPEDFMAPAVIRLGTGDRLMVNFDVLGDEHEYLRYKLIHCNADWQPSRLADSEFIGGFNEWEIDDYAYSSNTYVHYVNYNIEIPGPDMEFLASGNYLLQVYPEYEPDDLLLQIRFSVSENIMGVEGMMTTRTDKGFNSEYQQISLGIDAGGIRGINPYQDLIVNVTQNNRPETMRTVTHPLRVDGNTVIFDHDMNLIFEAGNEFRRFETVRADYVGMHVDSVKFGGKNWHAWLNQDYERVHKDYLYDQTQHGRFKIDEYNSTEPDLSADYITVHFSLDAPEMIGADVYIDGDFALHQFDDFNRMKFDYDTRQYYTYIPLKQGSYNYQYVVVPRDGGRVTSQPIEGNKYETRNEYLVEVYLRRPGSRADRLVGYTLIE